MEVDFLGLPCSLNVTWLSPDEYLYSDAARVQVSPGAVWTASLWMECQTGQANVVG